MILTLYSRELMKRPSLADQMFRLRARVFHDRLGWDVEVYQGRERDVYDDLDPLYVLSVDPNDGTLRGSVRILPTVGRHMMADIFGTFFDDVPDVQSPLIWECTRFCIDVERSGSVSETGIDRATSELLQGVCEAALRSGVHQILGVSEVPMLRIYRRAGWMPEIVGRSSGRTGVPVFAGLWDVTPMARKTILAKAAPERSPAPSMLYEAA